MCFNEENLNSNKFSFMQETLTYTCMLISKGDKVCTTQQSGSESKKVGITEGLVGGKNEPQCSNNPVSKCKSKRSRQLQKDYKNLFGDYAVVTACEAQCTKPAKKLGITKPYNFAP